MKRLVTLTLLLLALLATAACTQLTSAPAPTTHNVLSPTAGITSPTATPTPMPTRPPGATPYSGLVTTVPTPAGPTPSSITTQSPNAVSNLKVTFIDVGQGDSILIQSPDGKIMLVDGGEREANVVGYLQKQGIKQIDTLVATHPHSDHIGGLVDVLRQIKVKEVWTNGQAHTTKTFEDFLTAIDKSGAQYKEAKRGDTIALGGLTVQVLNPGPALTDDMNHNSIVLRLVYGEIGFLFMGDADTAAESEILATKQDMKAAIVKVGHHGSSSASSPAFLKAVSPKVAIYSAGAGNPYGHPHQQTIALLDATGAAVYGTDINGSIVVLTDGEKYTVALDKNASARAPPTRTETPTSQATVPPAAQFVSTPTASLVTNPTPLNSSLFIDIVSVTSPVRPGARATLIAKTMPGAECTIIVYYKSGPSTAQGLYEKPAGSSGDVSWTWQVGTRTTPGSWRIVVTASYGGKTASKTTYFAVQ